MIEKEHFIATLQACYFGDKNAFNEIVSIYDNLQNKNEKAIEYIENHFLYHYGSDKEPIVFEDNYIQEIVDILKGED